MQLSQLTTEGRNPATAQLDTLSPLQFVTAMNQEDQSVPRAIEKILPAIAQAVEEIATRLSLGGRLFYVGAGTSGRVGALDASECPPTFGTDPERVQYIIAGGDPALTHAAEGAEDSAELGRSDVLSRQIGPLDAVVGIAASGRTPYTIAGLEQARQLGAWTASIACNRGSALANAAHLALEAEVGPEVLAGSSRLKAGTAQKLICNMLTTGAMTRMGYVYENLMVNLQLNNIKLRERGIAILMTLTGTDRVTAESTIEAAQLSVPVALVAIKAKLSIPEARQRLASTHGHVRRAIEL